MQTKYIYRGVTALIVLLVVLAGFLIGMMQESEAVQAEEIPAYFSITDGGDCFADDATGDTYETVDGFCRVFPTTEALAIEEDVFPANWRNFLQPKSSHMPATVVAKLPKGRGNGASSGNTAIVVKDNSGSNKTETSCKNKNAGKDGTPRECNAGKGQEKK